ncbi:MAG TPA: enolase C-terminal domain-like protein [Bryobacteraceae bacterium]|nr:enolase C-terminal domain-like protein [Bryobacteraceae bacterium]
MRAQRRKLPGAGFAAFAPPAAGDHPLKIEQFRAWRVKEPVSNRRYTVVRVQSQGGTAGYGEGGPAVAAEIAAARDAAIGRRATDSEFIRSALRHTPSLEAAVSNAMLDLVSRAKNVPIYQYLGGPVRYKARLLGHLEGATAVEAAPSLERAKRQGIQAFTMAAPLRDAMIPLRAYVDLVKKRFSEMQALAGPSSEWVLDGAGAMTPGDAASVASALERTHPIWFDEPTGVITQDALAKIVDESVMPIGLGRNITDITGFQSLLASGSVNIVRPDLGQNSLTKIKRIAALSETHYVGIAPFHNGGPIGAIGGIHLNAALIYAYAQQIPVPASNRDAAMRAEITSGLKETGDKGFFALINRPGLGFEVNEKALDAFAEERI